MHLELLVKVILVVLVVDLAQVVEVEVQVLWVKMLQTQQRQVTVETVFLLLSLVQQHTMVEVEGAVLVVELPYHLAVWEVEVTETINSKVATALQILVAVVVGMAVVMLLLVLAARASSSFRPRLAP